MFEKEKGVIGLTMRLYDTGALRQKQTRLTFALRSTVDVVVVPKPH